MIADIECPICFENIADWTTNCRHSFCSRCIQLIILKHNSCPICRLDNPLGKKAESKGKEDQFWDLKSARAEFKTVMHKGRTFNRVLLVDQNKGQQPTNIQLGVNTRIEVQEGANIVVNGKRVQNKQQCSQQ